MNWNHGDQSRIITYGLKRFSLHRNIIFWRPQKDCLWEAVLHCFEISDPPVFSAKTVSTLKEKPEFCSYFNRLHVFVAARTKETQKTQRKCVFRFENGILRLKKTVNACVRMSCYVSPSAGICFTDNGLRSSWPLVLTGICSYFQLF